MNILTPTNDGSNTLFNEAVGEHYHSAHGALQESRHVFINAGLNHATTIQSLKEIAILEVGFGTGLNFILSYSYAVEHQLKLNYTGIEAFPLPLASIDELGYDKFVSETVWRDFRPVYESSIQEEQVLSAHGKLEIVHQTLEDFTTIKKYDLIYYDAFSVRHQPEMWSDEIIAHACSFLKIGGIFVSYAITGNLKRALKKCGFQIEKLPGAPGKREMIRGIKLS